MKHTAATKLLILVALSLAGAVGVFAGSAAAPIMHQLAGSTAPQAALGTSFTYQGYLTHDGAPINGQGQCDGQFGLWDAASGGAQLGGTQTVANLDVANGYFTVE